MTKLIHPYQRYAKMMEDDAKNKIFVPLMQRWRYLISTDMRAIHFCVVKMKISRKKFWEWIDESCEKFQTLPELILGTADENKSCYPILLPYHNVIGEEMQTLYLRCLVDLVDEEINQTIEVLYKQPKNTELMVNFEAMKNLLTLKQN